jgi:hypothetical protein
MQRAATREVTAPPGEQWRYILSSGISTVGLLSEGVRKGMPPPGIEPGTFCLQDRCSTTEPQRRRDTARATTNIHTHTTYNNTQQQYTSHTNTHTYVHTRRLTTRKGQHGFIPPCTRPRQDAVGVFHATYPDRVPNRRHCERKKRIK